MTLFKKLCLYDILKQNVKHTNLYTWETDFFTQMNLNRICYGNNGTCLVLDLQDTIL